MLTRRSLLRSAASAVAGLSLLGPRRARADAPKLLMVGDSLIAGGFGFYLDKALSREDGYVVDRRGKVSSGLARPDFYDWLEQGAKAYAEFRPDASLCMLGGNDNQGLYMGKQGGKTQWVRRQSEGWDEEYRRRINALADAIAPKDEWLFWIGMPRMRAPKLDAHVAHVNELFVREMALRPKARFIDIWGVLADDQGRFAEHMSVDGERVRVRAGDGVHISPGGGKLLTTVVRPRILEILGT